MSNYSLTLDEDSVYFGNNSQACALSQDLPSATPSNTETSSSSKTDRYGFIIEAESLDKILTNKKYQKNKKKESERTKKWLKMLKDEPNLFTYATSPIVSKSSREYHRPISPSTSYTTLIFNDHLKSRIRKGIPDSMRSLVWKKIFEHEFEARAKEFANYSFISQPANSDPEIVDLISRDVNRTFPSHSIFQEHGHGQESLMKILLAYANVDKEVNYCQGMCFIVGFFLIYLVEDEAYRIFHTIFQSPEYNLRKIFLPNFEEVKKFLFIFDKLLHKFLPHLHSHFLRENVDCSMYFVEWSMCLYTRGFHFDLLTRIWDIYLYEKNFKIIYRVGLGILKYFEKELLGLKFEKIISYLRNIQESIVNNANEVMDVTLSIPVKTTDVLDIEAEYEESLKNKGK